MKEWTAGRVHGIAAFRSLSTSTSTVSIVCRWCAVFCFVVNGRRNDDSLNMPVYYALVVVGLTDRFARPIIEGRHGKRSTSIINVVDVLRA